MEKRRRIFATFACLLAIVCTLSVARAQVVAQEAQQILDATWWHRGYWVVNDEFRSHWSGWWIVGNQAPSGRILSCNESSVSAEDGSKLAEYELESPPVFDGIAAANGRLYLSMKNGRVLCLE